MKKFLAILMCAVTAWTGMSINAAAGYEKKKTQEIYPSGVAIQTVQSREDDNIWKYSVSGGNATITGFDEEMYALMNPEYYTDSILYIPKEINGNTVVRIGEYAFAVNSDNTPYSFKKIVIPNTVTSIGGGAFYYNSQLEEVELEEGSILEKIEFYHSVELHFCTRINASDGAAFIGCYNLKRIGIGDTDMLPETLQDIEFLTFLHCVSLKSIDLSKCKLTQINGSVFYNCKSLTSVKFPRNLTFIGDGAFAYCESLKELSFPATLEAIGESYEDSAFVGCKSLESIRFETFEVGSNRGYCSLALLARGTFAFCENLTDVQLAESIYGFSISECCFQNTGLRSIDIPSCVTSIEDEAFLETKLANEAHTKNGDAYSIGIFGNPNISLSMFGTSYVNITPDEVPKIAGHGTNSNAYVFTVKTFGPEFFVDLDDYNPFHYPHTLETIPAVDATCQHTGLTAGERCTECGKIITYQEETPLGEHTPEIVPGKAATCTQKGLTDGEKCSVCGEIITPQKKIPVAEHTPEIIPGKEATETETGLTEGKKCSTCGLILVAQQTIPKLEHEHTPEIIPGKEPTETETGLTEGERCSTCGEVLVIQKVIPKLEHVHTPETIPGTAATCTQEGMTDGERCPICGKILKNQTLLPKTSHNFVNGICTVCGEEQSTKQIMVGDIDGDGAITSGDALALLRYSMGMSESDEIGKIYNIR